MKPAVAAGVAAAAEAVDAAVVKPVSEVGAAVVLTVKTNVIEPVTEAAIGAGEYVSALAHDLTESPQYKAVGEALISMQTAVEPVVTPMVEASKATAAYVGACWQAITAYTCTRVP